MTSFRSLAFVFFVSFVVPLAATRAAEPLLKPNDVVALVGGEDMVAASEYGYLELLLQRALPDYKLKFRCLAWEGDTVFEQPRELNYPTLEAQLDEIGATVVIMQFGQMESLAGTSKLPEFIRAYEKLIERVGADGKRRVIIQAPRALAVADSTIGVKPQALDEYRTAISQIGKPGVNVFSDEKRTAVRAEIDHSRDGVHASALDTYLASLHFADWLSGGRKAELPSGFVVDVPSSLVENPEKFSAAIRAKNRLWFHYYRPQNWAFLNGDRTEQPSSRDHKDPSKRWFPEEMKQFLSLVEAKEKEIWALAAKGAKP